MRLLRTTTDIGGTNMLMAAQWSLNLLSMPIMQLVPAARMSWYRTC
jgi:hypothetical protein